MKKLSVLKKELAPPETVQLFNSIERTYGMLPNMYAVIGNSPNALGSYFTYSQAQTNGSFNSKEREAIFLAVSQENGCTYGLSAHTAVAMMNGFSEPETLQLRAGTIQDKKLNVLTRLARSVTFNRGRADEQLIDEFFEAGFDQKALVDLVAIVIEKSFTNYIGRLSQPEIDFPIAKNL
ncbi:MAG: carboxymuconolactone decarboxylase family protein [Chitinophagaceae bacterium]